jgi:pilus assembly protein CpaB
MQSRLPIIVSLVVAVLAVLLTNMYVEQVRLQSEPPMSAVLVAARDLPAGTVIEKQDVAMGMRYTQALPKFHIPYSENTLYLGQEIGASVQQDDYVLATYFGGEIGAERRLSQKLDPKLNQRAVTIPIDNEQAFEGSLQPGDRIDILITYRKARLNDPAAKANVAKIAEDIVTVPLLENVYILATGKFATGQTARFRSITLLLSPDEAKLLLWAMNHGKISTLLRNPKDLQPTDRAQIAGDELKLDNLSSVDLKIAEVIQKRTGTE